MRIFNSFDDIDHIPNPVLTIGTFDGVHMGHQKIIQQLNDEAAKIGGESVLFTFYPHPRMVLYPDSHGVRLIQTQVEKLDKLKRLGLKNVIVIPFTIDFSRLSAIEFVRDYLVNKLKVKKMVIGYDHQFGKNREGSIEFLRDICDVYDFEVIEISAQEIDDVNVSSTKVRNAIVSGDIVTANNYLGEPFKLSGRVVKGKGIGRKIGFPTANLKVESDVKIIPGSGVYVVDVVFEGRNLKGMLNIGTNPTISEENNVTIELNIFDFDGMIYDEILEVNFIARIRDEQKFDSLEALIDQIKKDEEYTRTYLLQHH